MIRKLAPQLVTCLMWTQLLAGHSTRDLQAADPVELKIPHKEMARFAKEVHTVDAAVFSPDDRFVFVGCYNRVVVFRVPDGSLVRWYRTPHGYPASCILRMQLIEEKTKLLAWHWNSYATSVWDLATLQEGRDAEAFMLFDILDPEWGHRQHRLRAFGSWDAGRIVFLEYFDPEEATDIVLRRDSGPRIARLRLRRWRERRFEPGSDVDLSSFDHIWVAQERHEDGLRVAAAQGSIAHPEAWQRLTIRWDGNRGHVVDQLMTTDHSAIQSLFPHDFNVENALACLRVRTPTTLVRRVHTASWSRYYFVLHTDGTRTRLATSDITGILPRDRRACFACVFDVSQKRLLAKLPASHGRFVVPLAFSSDGQWLVTATYRKRYEKDPLLLWRLPPSYAGYDDQ